MYKILLVEDDPNFRAVLALALETRGYSVREAECGRSALELLQWEIPDLIISDLDMAAIDGRALCRHTRASETLSRIPFVILSAFVDPGDPAAFRDLPADCILSKQTPFAELARAIQSLIEGSSNGASRSDEVVDK